MADLNGEVIERMLFEEGFEFVHHLNPDTLVNSIKIFAGSVTLYLSEVWFEGDNWYIDTLSLDLVGELSGQTIDLTRTPIYDELSLIQRITDSVVGEIEARDEAQEYFQ